MRPHQWVKNLFVLAAYIFARGEVEQDPALSASLLAFSAFCLASSAVYLLNDVLDVESDRAHPKKRERPIAAGELSVPSALAASAACAGGGLVLGYLAGLGKDEPTWSVAAIVLVYMSINVAYGLRLKHVLLVDAFCIAAGFLLRVEAGGLAADAVVSRWMLLCTFFLALFLALCKRKAETDLLGEDRGEHRAILNEYDAAFLVQLITVLAACTILSYALYTIDDDTVARFGPSLVWSVPFVVFGIARYVFLVQMERAGGSPTRVLLGGDLPFAVNTLLWMGFVGGIVFGLW
jgi:4-hydroxybenzoate polyprenyltransferase